MRVEHYDAKEVEAVAYDMMVSGANTEAVSVLRLWKAQNPENFDMKTFSEGNFLKSMQEDAEAEILSKVLVSVG